MGKRLNTVVVGLVMFAVCAVTTCGWAEVPGFLKARMGTLNGAFYVQGRPLNDAIISFFNTVSGPPPIAGTARRVPDLVSRTGVSGKFSVQLPPGTYFMGAMIRERGQGLGPPRPGEHFFFAHDSEGALRTFEIKTGQATDGGRVTGIAPEVFSELGSFMTIRGVVSDEQGKPLSGIMVTLKGDLSAPRPQFISQITKEDGRYALKVPPGKYYVMAHESILGGRPRPGSGISMYGRTAPAKTEIPANLADRMGGVMSPGEAVQNGIGIEAIAVEGKQGEVLDGINMILFTIPDPEEIRRNFKEEALAGKGDGRSLEKVEPVR